MPQIEIIANQFFPNVSRMERQQSSEQNRLMDGNIYVLNVQGPVERGGHARGSGRGPIHPSAPPPPPPPPPPPSIPPPPPPPKDYPSAPFIGKPATTKGVDRLKAKFEQRHWDSAFEDVTRKCFTKTIRMIWVLGHVYTSVLMCVLRRGCVAKNCFENCKFRCDNSLQKASDLRNWL